MHEASDALLAARSTATLNLIDADASPGGLQIWSGGEPDKGRDVSAIPAHATSTAYTAGDYVTAGLHYYRAETSGTSAATAPTWPTDGNTVVDGGVTWQDMGETPALLGTLPFTQPAGTISGYTLSLTIAGTPTASQSGTAAWARIVNGANGLVYQGDCGTIGSGAFVEMATLNVVAGGELRADTLNIDG
jgi:hypothetical protein